LPHLPFHVEAMSALRPNWEGTAYCCSVCQESFFRLCQTLLHPTEARRHLDHGIIHASSGRLQGLCWFLGCCPAAHAAQGQAPLHISSIARRFPQRLLLI
jgi:hypothetical protein